MVPDSMYNILIFLTPPAATPTLRTLTNELKSVLDWHTLGINLELEKYKLDEIERNYHDVKRCRNEMLAHWLETTTPMWEAVAEALHQMEEHKVAGKIEEKYVTSTTMTEGIESLF